MDHISFISPNLFLSKAATGQRSTVEPFNRWVGRRGSAQPHAITVALDFNSAPLLKIVSHLLSDGRWLVTRTEANLPALVWGHNGRPLRSITEVALALTRARHCISMVTDPSGHATIVPGTGSANNGYIRTAELMVQIQDPGHCILRSTHQARLSHQHKPPLVVWGQSSDFNRDETRLRIYDKLAQRTKGRGNPLGIDQSRLEYVAKNAERLGSAVGYALQIPSSAGLVVSSITPADAYAVIRLNFSRLIGISGGIDLGKTPLSKTARLLMLAVESKPYAVECLLDDYRQQEKPTPRRYRDIECEVRNAVAQRIVPNFDHLLPKTLDGLAWADVEMPGTESAYATFLRDIGAPSEADSDIVEAWSKTSFLPSKPSAADLTGPVAPCPLPWLKTL